nr:reverse transcriptase domain-containing protein [Tanacetum cinerariifolium]
PFKFHTASSSGSGTLPSNTITNPKGDLKGITTRSGIAYKGPTIPTTSSLLQVVERETEPIVATVVEPVEAPISALKPNPKPSIPYPSRLDDQKLHEKANDQMEKFFQIFQDLNFNISLADAPVLMPKFASTIKTLADLGASIENAFSAIIRMKNAFSTRTISYMYDSRTCRPIDFSSGRGRRRCLRKSRKVPFPGRLCSRGLTLRVGNKAVTFNLDQTSRYSSNYDDILVNRIDVIDVACEEYSQEVLRFSVSSNPTPSTKPIVSTSSPTLTPFGDSDFLLDETDAFLATDDEPIFFLKNFLMMIHHHHSTSTRT